jgi:hypothetical protein
MKLKTLIVTVAVLAALSLVVFIVRRPSAPPSADARIAQPVVDATTIEQAARLEIADGGRTVTLRRQSDGTWLASNYHDLPVDFQKLTRFISNLTEAKLQRLVTSNPERIARLDFNDTRISLFDATDQPLWTVTLGRHPETGSGRFVRFGDEQKAYLANLNVWLDAEPRNWANPEILNLKPEDVARVKIPFTEGGPVTVSRAKKEDPWKADQTPEGQQVNDSKIYSVLSSVGTLRFSDTSEQSDPNVAAARANARTLELTTFDDKTITVALGRKPEEKKLKPPAPSTDGRTGPAALGSVADLARNNDSAQENSENKDDANPLAPEFETIPAGPVYAFVTHSDDSAPINGLMQKRAFQIAEYIFTGLPQKPDELFEAAPAATEAADPAAPGQP